MNEVSKESRKAKHRLQASRFVVYVILIFLSVVCLFSFYMLFVNATRSNANLQGGFRLLPSNYFFKNLYNAWTDASINIPRGMLNSFIIASCTAVLATYFSALTAYGIHAYDFKLKKVAFAFILAVMVIPKQVSAVGFYQMCVKLGWTNSYLPLIIPAIAAASTVFFFKQYLEANFQISLVEAARIDGAGEFYIYNKIIMPIMVPAMATMGIMAVIASWNNYLTPLMLLSDPKMKTLPMMVKELRGDIYRTEYGSIYLGLTMTALPLVIVYFCFSKYIIAGVAVGGVKE